MLFLRSKASAQSVIFRMMLLSGFGCSSAQNQPEVSQLTAIINRVDLKNGDFLFPNKLPRVNAVTALQLTRLPLRENGDDTLELIFSGMPYTPSVDGEAGDTIQLVYEGKIPLNGELTIEHVRAIRVTRKAPSA